ncbi:MAG TPA: transporter [Clostridiaceae bacterium]
MKKNIILSFQISTVFIGTLVGAGLASGQEIKQFFSIFGYKSFFGIMLCAILYILVCNMIIKMSIERRLPSYNYLIKAVSVGLLGNTFGNIISKVLEFITGSFILCSSGIILAGSGALLNQFLGIPKFIGIFLMLFVALITLLRNTKGLIEINSFIVPCLIIVVLTVFLLSMFYYRKVISLDYIKDIPKYKDGWLKSTFLYAGYNIFGCIGVLVPLSSELPNKKSLYWGIFIGSVGLTVLCLIINLLLMLNIPYIFHYEIPLLYIANRFGKLIQFILLIIIWLEMFSTEVSDVYSLGKAMENSFKISYNKSIIILLALALPISSLGFVNLITVLYPAFGVVSLIFVILFVVYYIKTLNTKLN